MPRPDIPVSVVIVTRNEEARIESCLSALSCFSEIIVVDSGSTDSTKILAEKSGARMIDFSWNGQYPKKRQWCLDNIDLKHEWILFVDADEMVTAALMDEIADVFKDKPDGAGYFIKGRYRRNGKILKYGLCNNKLALIDRRKMTFPVIDDLDLPGMGEIEGHYQPVLRPGFEGEKVGALKNHLIHDAYDDDEAWRARHERYAAWEAGMNRRRAWPRDPVRWRQNLKRLFRVMPGRPLWAFMHCYIVKLGFLDGKPGWHLACSRASYYRMIKKAMRA